MTTAVTLTTSWQKVADPGVVLLTMEVDGEVHYSFGPSAPSGANHHVAEDSWSIAGQIPDQTWMRLAESEDSGVVKVDNYTDPMDLGTGLSLISIAPMISISVSIR